jgi:uncharacterized protein (TIGR02270 family)
MGVIDAPSPARTQAGSVPVVIQQHVEDAATLFSARTLLAKAPHARLMQLRRFDDRLAAHLDGLQIAGESAWRECEAALERPSSGTAFAAAVYAIDGDRRDLVDRLLALGEAVPELRRGLISAFGWVESNQLRGMVINLLNSAHAFNRLIGIAACALHRVDPGPIARDAPGEIPELRARALRVAGELGQRDAVRLCISMLDSDDISVGFWAAWSAVLLGDRNLALNGLKRLGTQPGAHRSRAFRMALQVLNGEATRELMVSLAQDPELVRWAIEGAGLSGDVTYIPWLVNHMGDDKLARVAGEAFSLITGADLARLDLERKPPESIESGPTDNPTDTDVDMDQDSGLPWPDPDRIGTWWETHQHRFPGGTRYFLGETLSNEHCNRVLKNGYQRQRILAAHYLCLLEPGTVLFNTSAPAWRQQQLLAQID